jgi:hypothetical protein
MHIVIDSRQQNKIGLKEEVNPKTGLEGSYTCETPRVPHFVGSQFTGGGELIALSPRKISVKG